MILFCGKAEAGKTTSAVLVAQWLRARGSKVAKIAYGDYIKQTAKQVFGWNGRKDKAGRQLLQWWGTDVVLQKSPNFWIETVTRLAVVLDGVVDYLLIDDVRFPKEISCWLDPELSKQFASGLDVCVVRVNRPEHVSKLTPEQLKHPSETALDYFMGYDVILNANDFPSLVFELKTEFEKMTGVPSPFVAEGIHVDECDSEICRFAKNGYCTLPIEKGRQPRHEESIGCLDCEIIE